MKIINTGLYTGYELILKGKYYELILKGKYGYYELILKGKYGESNLQIPRETNQRIFILSDTDFHKVAEAVQQLEEGQHEGLELIRNAVVQHLDQ